MRGGMRSIDAPARDFMSSATIGASSVVDATSQNWPNVSMIRARCRPQMSGPEQIHDRLRRDPLPGFGIRGAGDSGHRLARHQRQMRSAECTGEHVEIAELLRDAGEVLFLLRCRLVGDVLLLVVEKLLEALLHRLRDAWCQQGASLNDKCRTILGARRQTCSVSRIRGIELEKCEVSLAERPIPLAARRRIPRDLPAQLERIPGTPPQLQRQLARCGAGDVGDGGERLHIDVRGRYAHSGSDCSTWYRVPATADVTMRAFLGAAAR